MRRWTILVWCTAFFATWLVCKHGEADPTSRSISYGSGGCGKLTGGQQVPCTGANFEAFTSLACVRGRTYLHPLIADTIAESYADLRARHPTRRWQYGDLGKKHGGPMGPHRTHQNGRAADFFFPVLDETGEAVKIPINASNQFGYGLDFSRQGQLDSTTIDWNAMADHLLALDAAGRHRGVTIKRILLAPALQTVFLRKAPAVRHLKPRFNKRRTWSLHDEHYHVLFDVPTKYKRPLRCD